MMMMMVMLFFSLPTSITPKRGSTYCTWSGSVLAVLDHDEDDEDNDDDGGGGMLVRKRKCNLFFPINCVHGVWNVDCLQSHAHVEHMILNNQNVTKLWCRLEGPTTMERMLPYGIY